MSRVTAIGLMSGTSYDGVDVALIETDGEEIGRSRTDRLPRLTATASAIFCGARSRPPPISATAPSGPTSSPRSKSS